MTTTLPHTPSYDLLHSLTFCVFDLETTGGNHQHDKIIEIGLVKIKDLKIVDQKSYLIKPDMHIPEFIQKLTSIKDADVHNAPLIEEVMDEILEFMGDAILVAHNTSFDVPFFNSVLRRMDRPELPNRSICTYLMTKYMIPNLLSSNLNYMSKIFNLQHQKAHRALDDANASAELLLKYLSIFIHKKISKVNSLYYPKNKFELDRINYKKEDIKGIIEQINSLKSPFLVTLKGVEGVVLFSMPAHGLPSEKEYIIKKIQEIPYEMLTLKLTGPYFQGLLEMSSYFSKISDTLELESIQKLCEFNGIDINAIDLQHPIEMPGDFIVVNHLIPEQYVIYPIKSLHQKLELVFRYPTHQNKLVQYINSKSARMGQNKMKKDHLNSMINNFLVEYLKSTRDFLIINRVDAKITNADIKERIEAFIADHPNNYDFPHMYL
ncbi:MAG: 3'-5' exonuclease [Bdellovibrionales bacterium]|nr:3'-5' exonuclease [Bdellovibrionales bacterium]